MKLYINGFLYAISYALDCVEREIAGVSTGHSKRVAYLCILMGKSLELDDMDLNELAACAIMHDSALTEFFTREYNGNIKLAEQINLATHCIMGEKNICRLPFSPKIKNAVLYHHENADGTGPFGKTSSETPLYAQLIHLGDILDVNFNFGAQGKDKYNKVLEFIDRNTDKIFDGEICRLFKSVFSEDMVDTLQKSDMAEVLEDVVPIKYVEYKREQLIEIMNVFAHIIDFKSKFTKNHSIGVAQKAIKMGEYYGFDDDKCCRLYIAGVLHDVGKMAVSNEILEKPSGLTDGEFEIMKNHALYTYKMLSEINGSKDIASWAASHHEKLDGTGYPFGKKADELDHEDRLLACIDIYQALSEERPYKKGYTHEKCIEIMKNMSKRGLIDGQIVEDIERAF